MTSTPKSSSRVRIIAGGQAEPPMTVRFRVERRRPFCFMWLMTPSQMVGTPALKVTRSDSNSACSDLPSRCGPGKTSLAPTSGALYGRPQALTWNIGTTGRMVSAEELAIASGSAEAKACSTVERWL